MLRVNVGETGGVGLETDEGETGEGGESGEGQASGPLRVVLVGDGGPFVSNPLNSFGGGSYDGLVVSIYIDENSSFYEWRRYLGGAKNEAIRDLAIDVNGRICGAGWTNSSNIVLGGNAVQTGNGGGTRDVLIGCWDEVGNQLSASYLGGKLAELNDAGISLANDGSLVVTGASNSTNLATTGGAYQKASPASDNNGFAFRLGSSGSPITWGSYLGGTGDDTVGVHSDLGSGDEVWMIGNTASANFPVTDGSTLASTDIGVARLSAGGNVLELGTLLGGSAGDFGVRIAALDDGTAVVCGNSYSDDFPTTPGAVQTAHAAQQSANFDVVVAHLDADGSVLAATYLGGTGFDACKYLDVDDDGNVYVAGWTDNLPDFPLTTQDTLFGPYNPNVQQGFLVKLSPDLETLEYAVRADIARGMDVLADGRVVYLAATNPGLAETTNAIPNESGNALIIYRQDGISADYLGYVMGESMTVYALAAVPL